MSRIKRWTLLGIVLVVAVMSGCKGIQEDETQEGANFYTLYHTALMAEDKVKMKELVSHNRKEVPKFVEDLLRASNAMMNLNMYTFPGVTAIEPTWAPHILKPLVIIQIAESISENYKSANGDRRLLDTVTKYKREIEAYELREEAWNEYSKGNSTVAVQKMWKAVNTVKDIDTLHKEEEAVYLGELGTMHVHTQKYHEGIGLLEEALNIFMEIKKAGTDTGTLSDRKGKPPVDFFLLMAHGWLGEAYSLTEMWEEAIIEFRKAIRFGENIREKDEDLNETLMSEAMEELSRSIDIKLVKTGAIFSFRQNPRYYIGPRRLMAKLYSNTTLSVWLMGSKMLRQHALTPFLPDSSCAVFQGFLTRRDRLRLPMLGISPLKINKLVTLTK